MYFVICNILKCVYHWPRYIPESTGTTNVFLLLCYKSISKKKHVSFTTDKWSEVCIFKGWAGSQRGEQWSVWWHMVCQWRCKFATEEGVILKTHSILKYLRKNKLFFFDNLQSWLNITSPGNPQIFSKCGNQDF